jgi:hypothetical protein
MSFVGQGCGAYVQETTYRYVGYGGDFNVIQKPVMNWCLPMCLCLSLLALLALLIIIFCPTTTSTTCEPLPPASCIIWGDPHIRTFDGSRVDFYDVGEFWLVKSEQIKIQGRYKNTPFTHGLSATDAIAVSGSFIGGNVLVVGAMETGSITWNGHPILTTFPSAFNPGNGVGISYNGNGQLVDNAMSKYERHIVHINLPLGVRLQVMRWSHHVNVRITMSPAPGGQDGHCGNFNGDGSDDSTAEIKARLGNGVAYGEQIFRTYLPFSPARPVTLNDCPADKKTTCTQQLNEVNKFSRANLFDCCFAGMKYIDEGSA